MNFEERYGTLDRLLYRIAFRGGTAQHAMADVEEMMYEEELDSVSADDPVLITSLPRAGTTILLKLLWNTGHFASHTYQDMPFVLCPLLWNQFSSQFANEDVTRERAHGDGLQVSGTSPEAFEDMVWKHFWPDHYRDDHIRPWTPDEENREFNAFFETHMRKVIAVRQEEKPDAGRYLSKNNLNIARLAAPPAPLDRGTFLVPFRDPLQQAASMYRQHERFLEIHEEDDFVREYMEAIGHHEFGKGLRPVNFDGWLKEASAPSELAFWVAYWVAAYRHILDHADDGTVLVSYARLTEEPAESLARLAEKLGIPATDLTSQADQLQPPRTHSVDRAALPDALLQKATETYQALDRTADV
jgi:Sulfotransferase domain.